MANLPKGLAEQPVEEEEALEALEAVRASGRRLQQDEQEAQEELMCWKSGAKARHSLVAASSLLWMLDTALEEDKDGTGQDEPHRQSAQSPCARADALALLKGGQLDSAKFHQAAEQNLIQQILL